MAITKCLIWTPPVSLFTEVAKALRQDTRTATGKWSALNKEPVS
jgi:hypothetical protein